jgi:hypothetical protein
MIGWGGKQRLSGIIVKCWNCNGALCSSPSTTYDELKPSDIIFFTETHTSTFKTISKYPRYYCYSTCRQETHNTRGIWGSRGIACLYRDSFQGKVTVVKEDEFSKLCGLELLGSPPPSRSLFCSLLLSTYLLRFPPAQRF